MTKNDKIETISMKDFEKAKAALEKANVPKPHNRDYYILTPDGKFH